MRLSTEIPDVFALSPPSSRGVAMQLVKGLRALAHPKRLRILERVGVRHGKGANGRCDVPESDAKREASRSNGFRATNALRLGLRHEVKSAGVI